MSTSREIRVVTFCLLLAAVTLAFYNPIVRNQFVDFDNLAYVLKNSHVQGGLAWATVKWAFTTFYQGNWHPLTWLSHALDCQFFGLNPVGHHYTSLLLHTANAVLLFLLLRRATASTWRSLVVAALFALHPVNVESVAWVAERKNVLSALFFLLALHAYDRYVRSSRRYLFGLVTVLFALGLMAKSQIVTLPFVLLLWDYWPLGRMAAASSSSGPPAASTPRSFAYLVWEKSPLFILAAIDSVVTVLAQRAGYTVRSLADVSLPVRLENALVCYVRYIAKAFWPSRLVPLYPRPVNLLPAWQVVGAAALLLLVSLLVLRWRGRRYMLVGWFWFLGVLVPMIGLVTVGDQALADRYAYLPFIGLFVAVVWGVDALASARRIPGAWRAAAALLAVCILGCLTHRQLGFWHDNETLWRYTLRVTERNYVAHNNLALALAKLGRSDEAVREFRAGAALHQFPPVELLGLGDYELRVGHPQEAIEACHAALRASSSGASADPKIQAAAWGELAYAHLQLHDYDRAADSCQTALRLNPEDSIALMVSGLLALHHEQFDVAVAQLAHTAKVDPSDLNAVLLVQALRRAGRTAEADSAWAQVQKISSDPRQAQIEATQLLTLVGLKLM
jgi:hypothetical protein